ncbi:MAG: tetratricopeptide repeat protein, partial [Candidatus Altiarchaeota archaeon]|nr:tetratricopeptide repeat protein [Candidatus Altiarchaeota archaeon]
MEEKKKKARKKSMDEGDLREITEEILDQGVEGLINKEKHLEKAIGDKKEEWAVKNLLRKARRLEEKEEYRESIDYYLRFIEKYLVLVKARKKYRLKDYYKAGDHYTKIAELYKKIHHIRAGERLKDMKKASEYYEKAAKIYLDGQEHSKANKSFLRSAEIFKELDLYEFCANQYINIAEIYRIKGDKLLVSGFYEKAAQEYLEGGMKEKTIEMILEAAKMKGEINDKEGVSEDYAKVADIYRSMRKHNKAIKYYAKSVEILYGIEKFIKLREIYDGIAEDYESLKKYDDAIYYYLSSGYLNKDNDNYAASNAFEGAGRCYSTLGDYKNAIKYYTDAADLRIDLAKYLDTAVAFKQVADCYRAIGDVESAAEYYFKYAEYGLMDEKGLSSIEGFKIASDIYLKLAESLPQMDEEKLKKVITLYKKLAKSHSGMNDHKKAGDSFFIAAELENDLDVEQQVQTYHDAITEYQKVDDLWDVGKSYARIGEYKDSVISYIQYAKDMLKKEDIFFTGEGYRTAGDGLNCLGNSKDASKNYNKALKYYLLYLQKTEKIKLIEEEKASQGNTLKHIGECYMGLGNLKVAGNYLKKALEYFKKHKMLREITYVKAFLDAIEAKVVMRSGDYTRTRDLLVSSIDGFDKLLEDKEYDREYVELFGKNKKEVEELLDALEKKPEVSLLIDRTSNTFNALPVIINIHIKNKSPITVYNISFLPHLLD